MTRLIDADKLLTAYGLGLETAVKYPIGDGHGYDTMMLYEIRDMIDNAPTVDAVEVVRKPVKGYEGYYEVDQFGRVFGLNRIVEVEDNGRVYQKPVKGKQMKQSVHTAGYKTVSLTKKGKTKTEFVHRIVAQAFLDNPNNLPFVNHRDEDRTNNFVENLEWCTVSYNSTYNNVHKKRAKKLVGIPHTDEHKEKISKSLKEYYQTNKSASIGRVSKKKKRVIGVKGNEVFHFDSICEASKFVNGARANITRSCNSEFKTAYGYKWMFENDYCSCGERKTNDDIR